MRKILKKNNIWGFFIIIFIYVRDRNIKIWGKYENLVCFYWSLKGFDSKKNVNFWDVFEIYRKLGWLIYYFLF